MLYYKTPNDRALLKIEILQEEREYILAAIASSPHNYFTNAWMSLALRYLSARIEELLTETLDIDDEYVPLKHEQIGADNPPDSLMPLDGDAHLPKSEYLWQGVMSDWKVKLNGH